MPTDDRKLISFAVPVFNEEGNVRRLYDTVQGVMAPHASRYRWEYVFTDNHSTDRTFELLTELAAADKAVRVLRFSRNFGYQRSILTGYLHAHGDAVVQLDCDLQDPPDLVPQMLAHWQAGHQVVFGVRRHRKEGFVITALRKVFYRLINLLSEQPLPLDAGDFRLVDRRVVEELRKLDDATPYLRGAIATLGFNQIGFTYDRQARQAGESKFRLKDLIRLGLDGILNHSVVPLQLATYVGAAAFVLAVVLAVVYAVGHLLVGQDWPAGFTTLAVLVLGSTGLNALFFGVMGEYVGRIYKQVKRGPLTVIEYTINTAPPAPPTA
ncbi:MAG: glycosyltransferase family 2 protein [Fimbriiglobus sp.]|jgi:dolichol-phosphate mannosyltransferase|nr:glycosyltransferase family 2 protein [Fimbriiglobus sp.]